MTNDSMNSQSVGTIDYASNALESPADRLLRRIVAWTAIVYGGESLIVSSLHVGLAKGWLASPTNVFWTLDEQWDLILMAAQGLVMCALMIGGVIMLWRSPASVIVIRVCVACTIPLSVASLAMTLHRDEVYLSYWSTPAAVALYAAQYLRALWLPVLLGLLTLPPLARRIL